MIDSVSFFVSFENTVFHSKRDVSIAGRRNGEERGEEPHGELRNASRSPLSHNEVTDWCCESVCAFPRLLFDIWTEGPDTRHSIPTLPSLTHPTPGDYCPLIDSSIGLGHQLIGEDTSLKKLVSGILLEEIFKWRSEKFSWWSWQSYLTNWGTPPSIHFNWYQLRRNTLYPIMCHIAHMWNKIEQIDDLSKRHITSRKRTWSFIWTISPWNTVWFFTRIFFAQGCFVLSSVVIGSVVLDK